MIQEIIVVEGKDDTAAVRRATGADTIETGGSAIDESVLRRIELADERRGVIVFTDPDAPGERIRKIVAARAPRARHAFLTRQEARGPGGGMGVEHASDEAIRRAIAAARGPAAGMPPGGREGSAADSLAVDSAERVVWEDLLQARLIVHPEAARRRARMGELLGIGYANGKQFLKRCTMLCITPAEFAQALDQLEKEGSHGS